MKQQTIGNKNANKGLNPLALQRTQLQAHTLHRQTQKHGSAYTYTVRGVIFSKWLWVLDCRGAAVRGRQDSYCEQKKMV